MNSQTTIKELDNTIQRTICTGMTNNKSLFSIHYASGFEEFGCYEGWDQGWIVSGKGTRDKEITAKHKELSTAISWWLQRYEAQ